MVEPVGYTTMWQKFENDVYNTIKKSFQDDDKYIVEWNPAIQRHFGKVKPDVLLSVKCNANSCDMDYDEKERSSCTVPAFIFDAYCKFEIDNNYFNEKNDQMEKYSKICDSILVMPKGYEQRPFCIKKNGNIRYHIISFEYIHQFLNSLKSGIEITYREDCCGDRPSINCSQIYRDFELSLRQTIDKCPNCKQRVEPFTLLYCSQYKEYSDVDFIEDTCIDCPNRQYFDECPFLSIESKYKCQSCGAVFDPESRKVIKDFDDGFYDAVISEFPYYKKKKE